MFSRLSIGIENLSLYVVKNYRLLHLLTNAIEKFSIAFSANGKMSSCKLHFPTNIETSWNHRIFMFFFELRMETGIETPLNLIVSNREKILSIDW